jgi:hypothetical protein
MLERYFIPLAPYALAALGLLVCLFLTVSAESDLRRLKGKLGRRGAPESPGARSLEARLADLTERLREAEDRAGANALPLPPKSSLNVNKRTQVLRLARRGEPVEKIAALLGIPRREVELLLKVQALSAASGGS